MLVGFDINTGCLDIPLDPRRFSDFADAEGAGDGVHSPHETKLAFAFPAIGPVPNPRAARDRTRDPCFGDGIRDRIAAEDSRCYHFKWQRSWLGDETAALHFGG